MSPEEQVFFPDNFENMYDFNTWYEKTNPEKNNEDTLIPTIDLNGKNPEERTWEEYQNLSPEEQMYFPDYFDEYEDYLKWYKEVCVDENI